MVVNVLDYVQPFIVDVNHRIMEQIVIKKSVNVKKLLMNQTHLNKMNSLHMHVI